MKTLAGLWGSFISEQTNSGFEWILNPSANFPSTSPFRNLLSNLRLGERVADVRVYLLQNVKILRHAGVPCLRVGQDVVYLPVHSLDR